MIYPVFQVYSSFQFQVLSSCQYPVYRGHGDELHLTFAIHNVEELTQTRREAALWSLS